MALPEDDAIVVILPTDISTRIIDTVKTATKDIERAKEIHSPGPGHVLIDLEAYNDNRKFWDIVRYNMLKSLVETYGDVTTPTGSKVSKNSRYVKISFNK